MGRSRKTIIALLSVAGLVGFLVLGYIKLQQLDREIRRAWTPIKDISRYEELLAKVRELELAQHFPDSPPRTAVGFNYTPHFLQASLVLQLKCRISEGEIDAVLDEVTVQRAKAEKSNRPIDPKVPRPYDWTETGGVPQRLDSSFEVHMLYAEDFGQDSFPWNHGSYEGIAIDRERFLILYFVESW